MSHGAFFVGLHGSIALVYPRIQANPFEAFVIAQHASRGCSLVLLNVDTQTSLRTKLPCRLYFFFFSTMQAIVRTCATALSLILGSFLHMRDRLFYNYLCISLVFVRYPRERHLQESKWSAVAIGTYVNTNDVTVSGLFPHQL